MKFLICTRTLDAAGKVAQKYGLKDGEWEWYGASKEPVVKVWCDELKLKNAPGYATFGEET